MTHVVTCEDLPTRVQQLAPALRAHAECGEQERLGGQWARRHGQP